MSNPSSRQFNLDRILILASLLLGLLHAWVGRYAMNPDGISYLDVGDAFWRHDWRVAANAWWSPLYPWAIGAVLGIAKPSPRLEFPLVHLVNFGVFVAALFAFRFFLRGFLQLPREKGPAGLPDWAFSLLGYGAFLWIALEVETVYDVSPDLAVLASFCLSLGVLIRLRPSDRLLKFALFGLTLGLGYWTKAILLPLGFAILAVGWLWKHSSEGWGRGMAMAALVFICSATPLIVFLSHQKGRFTFSDSGRVNYAWAVSPRTATRNWQGVEPGSGTPSHPTRQLLKHPPLFEFDGPITGTYPPWTDPSYWNEGLRWHFSLKGELQVLATTLPSEIRLALRDRPELCTGIIILVLLGGQLSLIAVRKLWPFLVLPLLGLGIYLPLIENDRYLGGFLLALLLAIFASVRFLPDIQKIASYVCVAMFITMVLATGDYTVRILMHHMAIPGNGPNSTAADLVLANKLQEMGAGPGTKVAIIGDGTGAYWARLGKLRIVAEIMGMGHGPAEFWSSSDDVRQQVYDTFRKAHAKVVVTLCPACPPGTPSGWDHVAETPFCVRRID